jgi:2-polyprenyl-3-methyl-5-hydroxy-6-metoxy-1,4-benzoquinol methylase
MPPRSFLRQWLERLVATTYGFTYDRIVERFEPYQMLVHEVRALVARSAGGAAPATVKVLDVACGTGTVALALARDGYQVTGFDVVEPLVRTARERGARLPGPRADFQHVDVAAQPVPGGAVYDVVVSMHTLYWHPQPAAFLEGCRRALRAGGHGIFLTYSRPAHVGRTFRELRQRHGLAAAVSALRWLVPTALFESFRDYQPHYMSPEEFHEALRRAGFEVLDSRRSFLADISLLAWIRTEPPPSSAPAVSS